MAKRLMLGFLLTPFFRILLCFPVITFILPFELRAQVNDSLVSDIGYLQTNKGTRFGIWKPQKTSGSSPVLFVLASTIDETLGSDYFRQCGTRLSIENGWLCVSLDLPYHGEFQKEKTRNSLLRWAKAARQKEDFVAWNNARMKDVLDYLIRHNYADETMVFVCGTSRGGYLALQFAAFEKRVKAVAAFAPVTDLTALREFQDINEKDILPSFSLNSQLTSLAGTKCWIVIGDRDARVNTDKVIHFARQLSAKISDMNAAGSIELGIFPEPKGHTTPAGSADRAVEWFRKQISDYPQRWDSASRPNIFYSRIEMFRSLPHSSGDIIMLGSSITFWGDWPELLQSAKIKNRGIPGDNTFGVLERLDEVINRSPAKVFILIGINDIAAGIPDSIIAGNLKRMVQRIKSGSPKTRIYFQTLLPTNSAFPRKVGQFNKEDHIANVNTSIKNIAAEENINLIDLFPVFSDSKGQLMKKLSWDGVHLTASGYYKWAELLKDHIF